MKSYETDRHRQSATSLAKELTRRDILALDRTRLANHRTVLAYMRTVIILVVSGITLIKLFSDEVFLLCLGLAFLPLAFFFLITGTVIFFVTKKKLADLYRNQHGWSLLTKIKKRTTDSTDFTD